MAGRAHLLGRQQRVCPLWNGYLEGAVRSGEATAQVVAAL
jgi:monoamine oxidase